MLLYLTPQKADNTFVTCLVFRVSMNCAKTLPSGDTSAHLPAYLIKNIFLHILYVFTYQVESVKTLSTKAAYIKTTKKKSVT